MSNRITIRMGAGKFEANVRTEEGISVFDLGRMQKRDEDNFRVTLVRAFREAQQQSGNH